MTAAESVSPRAALLGRAVDWFAQHGVGDTSLRGLATGLGSSHRMLLYHFGSREGLLAEVVAEVWRRHRLAFDDLLDGPDDGLDDDPDGDTDPARAAWRFWTRLADGVEVAALYAELSAAAMQGHAWAAEPVRRQREEWTRLLATFFERLGNPPEESALLARTSMVMTRGTLEMLALDGDREAADAVMAGFLETLQRGPSGAEVGEEVR